MKSLNSHLSWLLVWKILNFKLVCDGNFRNDFPLNEKIEVPFKFIINMEKIKFWITF